MPWLVMLTTVALSLASPPPKGRAHDGAKAPSRVSMTELTRRLVAVPMRPQRSSFSAMIAVGELWRKFVAPAERSCRPPLRGRWADLGVGTEWIELSGERQAILYRAPRRGRHTIILVHGLFDSKYSRYLEVTADILISQGYGVVVPDMRGHGCRFADSPPSLGLHEAEDLVGLATWIQARRPASKIGLVGFSLGALSVLHALAHPEAASRFVAGAVVLCPPGDLEVAITRLDRRPGDIFGSAFRRWLRPILRRWRVTRRYGAEFRSAVEWLAVYWGYENSGDFLAAVSPGTALPRVARPLVIYAAYDDPFFGGEGVAYLSAAPRSCFVRVHPTAAGGHLGHLLMDPAWFATSLRTFFASSTDVTCTDAQGVNAVPM